MDPFLMFPFEDRDDLDECCYCDYCLVSKKISTFFLYIIRLVSFDPSDIILKQNPIPNA